ncbi:MAG: OmpA family protein [Elusimicrobiota bacterium]
MKKFFYLLPFTFYLLPFTRLYPQDKIKIFSKGELVNQIASIKFSPDNRYLGVATNYWVELRAAQTLRLLKTFENHKYLIKSFAFSPDGNILAIGYTDGSIKLWDTNFSKELRALKEHTNVVTSLTFSPNSKYLASGDWGGCIFLWDVHFGKRIRNYVKHLTLVTSLDFSPRGDMLASACADNSIIVWNVKGENILYTILDHFSTVSCIKWNKQGDKIYSSSWDKTIQIWDMRFKASSVFARLSEFVNSISLSADEEKLACGLVNGTVIVYNTETRKVINTFSTYDKTLLEVAFSPSDKLVSAGDTNTICSHKLERRLSEVPEIGSDIWLNIDIGDIGELFDMLKEADTDRTFLATEKKGLIKSDDGKTNWQRIDEGINDVVVSVEMDAKKTLYVGTKTKGIFETKDLGATWKEDNDGLFEISKGIYPEIFDITVQPKTNKKYVATANGIYKKEKKWDSVSKEVVQRLCFSPKEPKKLYAGNKKGGLFLSNDAGKSWNLLIKEEDETKPVRSIAVDPDTAKVFVARGDEGILVSDDDKLFRAKNYGLPTPIPPLKVHSVKINPKNSSNIFVATDKGVFVSRNRGDIWKDYNDGLEIGAVTASVEKTKPKFIAINNNEKISVATAGGISSESGGQIICGGLFEVGKVQDKKVMSSINFEIDSAEIRIDAFPVLNELLDKIRAKKKPYIVIHGHTDNTGTDEYNLQLSLNRAQSVKNYFVGNVIAANKIRTAGFGKSKPLVSNETEEGRAKNRRVEILIAGFEE